jgi:hypothetical protein
MLKKFNNSSMTTIAEQSMSSQSLWLTTWLSFPILSTRRT